VSRQLREVQAEFLGLVEENRRLHVCARRTKDAPDCKKAAFSIVKSEALRLEVVEEIPSPSL
jgi:hypothetical protein